MVEVHGDAFPDGSEADAVDPGTAPIINPFAGDQAVEPQPSRLGLGGSGVLEHAGVFIPPSAAESAQGPETMTNVQVAARKACHSIAEMFIKGAEPDGITFPICNDMAVIGESLKQLTNTPLGLGYGSMPPSVYAALGRFMRETTEHYRSSNGLEEVDLVPLRIEVPEWLKENPNFDILAGCRLMDIEISGVVGSMIASQAANCRIRFRDAVATEAVVGQRAERCTFIFDKDLLSREGSFKGAKNISVQVVGNAEGNFGPVGVSRFICEGGFTGYFFYKGQGSSWSPNVRAHTESGY